ncbi:MAG: VWA domain-containing protein, partial [Candidatus Omnitrophota bacterium]
MTVFPRINQRLEKYSDTVSSYFSARIDDLDRGDPQLNEHIELMRKLGNWYYESFAGKDGFPVLVRQPSHHEALYFRISVEGELSKQGMERIYRAALELEKSLQDGGNYDDRDGDIAQSVEDFRTQVRGLASGKKALMLDVNGTVIQYKNPIENFVLVPLLEILETGLTVVFVTNAAFRYVNKYVISMIPVPYRENIIVYSLSGIRITKFTPEGRTIDMVHRDYIFDETESEIVRSVVMRGAWRDKWKTRLAGPDARARFPGFYKGYFRNKKGRKLNEMPQFDKGIHIAYMTEMAWLAAGLVNIAVRGIPSVQYASNKSDDLRGEFIEDIKVELLSNGMQRKSVENLYFDLSSRATVVIGKKYVSKRLAVVDLMDSTDVLAEELLFIGNDHCQNGRDRVVAAMGIDCIAVDENQKSVLPPAIKGGPGITSAAVWLGAISGELASREGKDGGDKDPVDSGLIDCVRNYYLAKRALVQACAQVNPLTGQIMQAADQDGYDKALNDIMSNARLAQTLVERGSDLIAAVDSVRSDKEFKPEEIKERQEIIHAAGYEFNAEQKAIIDSLAREWSKVVAEPKYQQQVYEKIIAATVPLSAERFLSAKFTQQYDIIVNMILGMFGVLEKSGLSATASMKIKESFIIMQRYPDMVQFRGSLSHEMFHFLGREGYIPLPHYSELVAHAISTAEFYKIGGPEAIKRIECGLRLELFEAGRKLARTEKSLKTLIPVSETTYNVIGNHHAASGWLNGEAKVNIASLDIEREMGRVLAGWAVGVNEDLGIDIKVSLFEFARNVLSQPRGMAPLTPEDLKGVMGIAREIEILAHTLSGNYHLTMVPWRPVWEGDQPSWRIIKEWNEFHFVPEDLAYLPQQAALGLAMEELLRLLYFNPRVIEAEMKTDGLFMTLIQVMQTPRAVKKGLKSWPGAEAWFNKLYEEQYDKASEFMKKIRTQQMPLYIQYLEAALYEARRNRPDAQFCDEKVVKALEKTKKVRAAAVDAVKDHGFYKIVKKDIWPVLQELYKQSEKDQTAQQQFEEMVKNNQVQLPGPQQQMAGAGSTPSLKGMPSQQRQQVEKQIEQALKQMTPQQKEQLAKEVAEKLAQAEKEFARQNLGLGTVPQQITPQPQEPRLPSKQQCQIGDLRQLAKEARETSEDINDQVDSMMKQMEQAKNAQRDLTQKAGSIRQSAADKQPQQQDARELERQSRDIKERSEQLSKDAEKLSGLSKKMKDQACELCKDRQESEQACKDSQDLNGRSQDIQNKTGQLKDKADDLANKVDRLSQQIGNRPDNVGPVKEQAQQVQEAGKDVGKDLKDLKSAADDYKEKSSQLEKMLGDLEKKLKDEDDQAAQQQGEGQKGEGQEGEGQEGQGQEGEGQEGAGQEGAGQEGQGREGEGQSGQPQPSNQGGFSKPDYDEAPTGPLGDILSNLKDKLTGAAAKDEINEDFRPDQQQVSDEARQYLAELAQRRRSDWQSLDQKANDLLRQAKLEEHGLTSGQYDLVEKHFKPVSGLVNVMRQNLQQQLQKNMRAGEVNDLLCGDELDDDNLALVRASNRIFREEIQPNKYMWRLSLIVDLSGSMGGEKVVAAVQTVILYAEALNKIKNIEFEIVGFENREFIPLKLYADVWNLHKMHFVVAESLRVASHGGGTNDVGALISAIERIRAGARFETNKMIFIITDGCSGMGGYREMSKIMDKNRDIRIFGWGVGSDMQEVEETYKPYGIWVPEVPDLPVKVGEILRRELGKPVMIGRDNRDGGEYNNNNGCEWIDISELGELKVGSTVTQRSVPVAASFILNGIEIQAPLSPRFRLV